MSTQRAVGQRPLSTTDVAIYIGGLAVGLAATHAIIGVVDHGRITTLGGLALAAVAAFMVGFMYIRRAALTQRRFGYYFLHVIAFLMVNASFVLHAFVMHASGRGDVLPDWRGVLFAMPLAWSIGVLLHTLGTVVSGGYERVEV